MAAPEEVPLFWNTMHVERCSNADEGGWQSLPGQQNQYAKVPSRCQGFFGRFLGLYFDTLPLQREMAAIAQEERDWGYGGLHEGAARWEERPEPPAPPTDQAPPAEVHFVTASGKIFTASDKTE